MINQPSPEQREIVYAINMANLCKLEKKKGKFPPSPATNQYTVERQGNLLKLLKDGPKTEREMASMIGVTPKTAQNNMYVMRSRNDVHSKLVDGKLHWFAGPKPEAAIRAAKEVAGWVI